MPTVAIMQPYLFPYIGYFQLINACDLFVSFDNVAYIKGGWINRNRILRGATPIWLTLPVQAAPHTLDIKDRVYVFDKRIVRRFLALVVETYRSAPYFECVFPMLKCLMEFEEPNVAKFNTNALRILCEALRIKTPIVFSSETSGISQAPPAHRARGAERVIGICKRFGADRYINSIGGRHLYEFAAFRREGIELAFINPSPAPYLHYSDVIPNNLSIIDVMMFNDVNRIATMLTQFEFVHET